MTRGTPGHRHRAFLEARRDYIFLVSHMRSYSTLLGHLLASSVEIDGYSELHRSYESELDLVRMAIDVQNTHDEPLDGRFLFDKLLHRGCVLANEIIERPDTHLLFAVRSPAPTIASLVELGSRDASVRWAADIDGAARHYTRRLADVAELAQRHGQGTFLFADSLVADPGPTLFALGQSLGLRTPIPHTYERRPLTGKKRFGDSSAAIRSGEIQPASATAVDLPAGLAASLDEAYRSTIAIARDAGLTLIGQPVETG